MKTKAGVMKMKMSPERNMAFTADEVALAAEEAAEANARLVNLIRDMGLEAKELDNSDLQALVKDIQKLSPDDEPLKKAATLGRQLRDQATALAEKIEAADEDLSASVKDTGRNNMDTSTRKEVAKALRAAATKLMATRVPSAKDIYKQYLAPNATDTRGKKYVFGSDQEPDHFKLAEAVLGDMGVDADHPEHDDLSDAVHEACEDAEQMWLTEQEQAALDENL